MKTRQKARNIYDIVIRNLNNAEALNMPAYVLRIVDEKYSDIIEEIEKELNKE